MGEVLVRGVNWAPDFEDEADDDAVREVRFYEIRVARALLRLASTDVGKEIQVEEADVGKEIQVEEADAGKEIDAAAASLLLPVFLPSKFGCKDVDVNDAAITLFWISHGMVKGYGSAMEPVQPRLRRDKKTEEMKRFMYKIMFPSMHEGI